MDNPFECLFGTSIGYGVLKCDLCNILGVLEILSSDVASFSSEMLGTLIAYLSRRTSMLAWRLRRTGCSSCFERPRVTGGTFLFPSYWTAYLTIFRRSLMDFVEFPEK